ncbi:hypothetical protein MPSEU_000028400 [Mayamaea pseudoterrestris]|nr:hypothetical protein MPSEU_000028400 [Mayamaea pseudoterrestris]
MVKFTGFCTYPHGGKATTGIFFVVAAALSATCYGIASCRLLVLTFDASGTGSEGGVGCFEEYFQIHNDVSSGWDNSQSTTNSNATSAATWCQVGMGLFQWMRPNEIRSIESNSTSSSDWQDGYCVGYQQTMLDSLGDDDPLFHVARGLGIFSVILSFVLLGWTFVMSCLELNWMQIFLLRLCCLMASLTSELSFLMKKTAICSSMFDATANCKLDQGGLAMVTACILWLIALVMSIVFMESSTYCPLCRRRTNGKERAIESAKTTLKARGTVCMGIPIHLTRPSLGRNRSRSPAIT